MDSEANNRLNRLSRKIQRNVKRYLKLGLTREQIFERQVARGRIVLAENMPPAETKETELEEGQELTLHIKTLGISEYEIIKPIPYTLKKEEGEFVGEIEQIGVYNYAKKISGVLPGLLHYLKYTISIVDKPDEKLGPDPIKWKKFIFEHVRKRELGEGWAYCNVCPTGIYMPGKEDKIISGVIIDTVDAYICNVCGETIYPLESMVKLNRIERNHKALNEKEKNQQ